MTLMEKRDAEIARLKNLLARLLSRVRVATLSDELLVAESKSILRGGSL